VIVRTDPAPEYEKALKAAEEELAWRLQQKAENDNRIAWLKTTIASLQQVAAKEATQRSISDLLQTMWGYDPQSGLTDSIRYVLCNAGRALGPIEIAHQLHLAGFELSKYQQPSAVVHTTLERLAKHGEVRRLTVHGHKVYEWVGSPFVSGYTQAVR